MAPVLTHDTAPGTDPEPPTAEGPTLRRQVLLSLGIACFLAMAIFWALLLTGTFNTTSPDRLADRAWVKRAEQRCKAVQNQINDLPKAQTAKTPADRAAAIDRGTADLQTMVGQLTTDQPASADEQRVVAGWIADWHVYLDDRSTYAAKIQQDPHAQALFSERHGENVATAIDGFAAINDMPDCATPTDM